MITVLGWNVTTTSRRQISKNCSSFSEWNNETDFRKDIFGDLSSGSLRSELPEWGFLSTAALHGVQKKKTMAGYQFTCHSPRRQAPRPSYNTAIINSQTHR